MDATEHTDVCVVSSVQPIELTAALLLDPNDNLRSSRKLRILYLQDRAAPTTNIGRYLSANSAIPTPALVRDSGGVLRQVFIPIANGGNDNSDALAIAMQLTTHVLETAEWLNIDVREKLLQRCRSVFESAVGHSSRQESMSIINAICRQVPHPLFSKPGRLTVESYELLVAGEEGQLATKTALTRIAESILRCSAVATGGRFQFQRGGHVLAHMATESVRFSEGVKHSERIELLSENRRFRLRISSFRLDIQTASGTKIRPTKLELRGPLLQAFLTSLGRVIDVPWYLPRVYQPNMEELQEAPFWAVESISPVSASAPERTFWGSHTQALRLSPSGYSLLDYNHSDVLNLVSAFAMLGRVPTHEALADWRALLEQLPPSKQKLLKSQSAVNRYVNSKIKESVTAIKTSPSDFYQDLMKGCEVCGIESIGKQLIRFAALMRHRRSSTYTKKETLPPNQNDQYAVNASLGRDSPCAEEEWNNSHVHSRELASILARSSAWRERVLTGLAKLIDSLPPHSRQFFPSEIYDLCTTRMISLDPSPYSTVSKSEPTVGAIESEARAYYSTVSAIAGNLLKAHVLNILLALPHDKIADAMNSLMARRGPPYHLILAADLWCLVSDTQPIERTLPE